MKQVMVDTDILSMFFKNNRSVVLHFKEYLKQYDKINLSIITYYEIASGLKHRDALKQLDFFLEFAKNNAILPLTEDAAMISADLYVHLRTTGKPIDDIDILIAGIALSNNLALVTHNKDHFKRIGGLEDWNEEL